MKAVAAFFMSLFISACNQQAPELNDQQFVRKSCEQVAHVKLLMNRIDLTAVSLNNENDSDATVTDQQRKAHSKAVKDAEQSLKALNMHQTQMFEWIAPRADNYMNVYVTCLEFEGVRTSN